MMSLTTYAKYIVNPEGCTDDSPLAIYDSEFGDDASPTNVLVDEYDVPPCFSPDLFAYSCGEIRPPYRWILIGPERSGTGLHIDPLFTNAWVTLLQGRKRWLLFPPDTPPELIGMDGPIQIPSSIWFSRYYDRVTKDEFAYPPVEVLQRPGETVFVPSGWPHLVLNLELTVSVTHNYASEHGPNFGKMWHQVVEDEPEFAAQWLAGLQEHRPDLVERIRMSQHAPDTTPPTANKE
jgi:histone arginine demethylase JMJD6